MPALNIVVPVYNERDTLEPCLRRVVSAELPAGWDRALFLVDDHSEPAGYATAERLTNQFQDEGHAIALLRHDVNRGKGAALQTGFDAILASEHDPQDLVIIQDADLEYDPDDYSALMKPLLDQESGAVLGTRWGDHVELRGFKRRLHAWGNQTLTTLSNLMTGYRVSDMECCYKLMTIDVLRQLRPLLSEERFGIEPQIIAGLARLRVQVVEVPIRYDPRGMAAGKKIGWTDGARALYVIARERLRGAPHTHQPGDGPDEASAGPRR